MYSDKSPLEMHHLATAFSCIQKSGLFSGLSLDIKRQVRDRMIGMVLGTDFSRHVPILNEFKVMLKSGPMPPEPKPEPKARQGEARSTTGNKLRGTALKGSVGRPRSRSVEARPAGGSDSGAAPSSPARATAPDELESESSLSATRRKGKERRWSVPFSGAAGGERTERRRSTSAPLMETPTPALLVPKAYARTRLQAEATGSLVRTHDARALRERPRRYTSPPAPAPAPVCTTLRPRHM